MNVRRSFVRVTALTVVMAMPLLGMAGAASAKAVHGKHHHSGGGTGGAPANIIVTVSPNGTNNPLFEVGQSEIDAVVQVETQPSFAGDQVTIALRS
jgi:hypothetical protein